MAGWQIKKTDALIYLHHWPLIATKFYFYIDVGHKIEDTYITNLEITALNIFNYLKIKSSNI